MKIGIFSDLHLDFFHQTMAMEIINNIVDQAANVDLLINAGDLSNGGNLMASVARKAFRLASPYLEVDGNHDCYGSGLNPSNRLVRSHMKDIALATLWTDCHNDPMVEYWFMNSMADATEIPKFSIAAMKHAFAESKNFIFDSKPEIVVTHNPPSMLSVGPRFVNAGVANKAFIPELGNEIADSNIKLWICGHVHHKHEYMIGNTKVVCNPLGYPGEIYKNPLNYKLHIEEL